MKFSDRVIESILAHFTRQSLRPIVLYFCLILSCFRSHHPITIEISANRDNLSALQMLCKNTRVYIRRRDLTFLAFGLKAG